MSLNQEDNGKLPIDEPEKHHGCGGIGRGGSESSSKYMMRGIQRTSVNTGHS